VIVASDGKRCEYEPREYVSVVVIVVVGVTVDQLTWFFVFVVV